MPEGMSTMLPLIDMANHRQPQRLDQSDLVSFKFQLQDAPNMTDKKLGLIALTEYTAGEEYNYSYSREIDVMAMLISYGMAFENAPYSSVTI